METSNPPTVAIVSAGAMGAGLAKRLTTSGCKVMTMLEGRSEDTKQRATDAGMEIASISDIIREASWVLSILPPSTAESFAREFLVAEGSSLRNGEERGQQRTQVFVDCNAKNPETARNLATLFQNSPTTFLDACIVGLPPEGGHDPAIYASADQPDQHALEEFRTLEQFGLRIKILNGNGSTVGDASALKMTYSGIMKGMVGLYEIMILSAYSHSPIIADELLKELNSSQPLDLQRIAFYVPQSFSKAYRFVREMEEMKGFVEANVDGPLSEHAQSRDNATGNVAQVYSGFGSVYQRLAHSVAGRGHTMRDGLSDVDVLRGAAEKANKIANVRSQGL